MIVLFDGVCNLCSRSVQFIFPRDEKGRIRLAPLQSTYARVLLAQYGVPQEEPPSSVVLISGGRAFTGSDAALRILGALRFPWNLMILLLAIPRFIREGIYRYIASRRYGWFGRRETCWLPDPHWQGRFIDVSGENP